MKKFGRVLVSMVVGGTVLSAHAAMAGRADRDEDTFASRPSEVNTSSENSFIISSAEAATKIPMRPTEYDVNFDESLFAQKPWMNDFKYVVVVNRAESGSDSQTVRVYKEGRLVTLREIQMDMYMANMTETDSKKLNERVYRAQELESLMYKGQENVFKVSTGRNQFEKKGTNHAQKDNWTTTPTGYYTIQYASAKHKSESYSSSMCDSIFGKALGFVMQKEMCTMMEYALFFNGGIALHKAIPGTEGKLGHKASGGCVRLPAALAEYLFRNAGSDKGRMMPKVNPDGSPKLNSNGEVAYSTMTESVWGATKAWSTLVIVQDQVK